MHYRKPQYYDHFQCLAGSCPDTCCAGWQIVIDEQSMEKYSNVKTDFGIRLLNSIDWYQGTFEQCNRRCSFLNEENLCDIYQELGSEALCQTCRQYPRHVEEFEDLREYSLSLSCPEAARIILSEKGKTQFDETEDNTEEEEEDYQNFDLLLFDYLETSREFIFSVIQDRKLPFPKRMGAFLLLSFEIQKALEKGELFELDLEKNLRKILTRENRGSWSVRFRNMKDMAKDLEKLEILREGWKDELENLQRGLYDNGEEAYRKTAGAFEENLIKDGKEELWDIWGEQILVFFVYTYFCGAVYDNMVYSKAVLSVFSVIWIREISMKRCCIQNEPVDLETVCRTAWEFAREIEHSDQNLDFLEEIFSVSELYFPENFLPGLVAGKEVRL